MKALESSYGICHLSIVPVRQTSSDKSEMTTQLLFGETFRILEISENNKWIKIQSTYDQYEGWVDKKQYKSISEEYYQSYQSTEHLSTRQGITVVQFANFSFPIVAGSVLPFLNELMEVDLGFATAEIVSTPEEPILNNKIDGEVLDFAYSFLAAPYLWGGRSHFGIDCSGLCQQIFRALQITIPRDAWQQALVGTFVNIEDSICGDLAFFKNEDNKIVHVGMVLDGGQILHASGEVRIDQLDNRGIYNSERQQYSHYLSHLKRVL